MNTHAVEPLGDAADLVAQGADVAAVAGGEDDHANLVRMAGEQLPELVCTDQLDTARVVAEREREGPVRGGTAAEKMQGVDRRSTLRGEGLAQRV